MARTERDQAHLRSLVAGMVPQAIAKQIDDDELTDRLGAAARLMKQAAATTSPAVARAFGDQARAILEAQPRDVTLKQVHDLMTKSARSTDPDERERHRAKAERVKAENPFAPQRRGAVLRKAADSGMLPVYDAVGNLVAVCPPDALIPIAPGKPMSAAPVTKAARDGKRAPR